MITSISAITLATHDMARAVRFYRALGFEIADSIFNQALTSSNLPANAGIGDLFALLPQTAAAGP